MARTRILYGVIASVSVAVLGGCQQPSWSDIAKMKPARSSEMDRLNAFVGEWEGSATMKMMGMDEPLKSTSTSVIGWDLDKNVLVERYNVDAGEMGTMKGMGLWAWDHKAKKYRTLWVDDWGSVGLGTAKYNERTGEWRFKAKSHGPEGTSYGKGKMTFSDDGNHMKWCWSESAFFGLIKVFEMEGDSHRK